MNTTGWQQLPPLIYQPENNFSYIMWGGTLRVSARSGASHPVFAAPARIELVGFIHRAPEMEVPKAPVGLSAHRHPPRRLILTPTTARTYLHHGQGSGPPGLVGVGCSAVSPQRPGARQRCAGSAGCHGRVPGWGKVAADGSKVLGEQQGGREGGGEPSCRPPSGLAPRPLALPERAGTEPMAAAGLPTQEICQSCLQLSATGAFRAVMQNPPHPCGGIFTRLQPHTLPVP